MQIVHTSPNGEIQDEGPSEEIVERAALFEYINELVRKRSCMDGVSVGECLSRTLGGGGLVTEKVSNEYINIAQDRHAYHRFVVSKNDEIYDLYLGSIGELDKKFILCMAEHAVRLKKNIVLISRLHTDTSAYIDWTDNGELFITCCGREHSSSRATSKIEIQLDNKKISLAELNKTTINKVRCYSLPSEKGFDSEKPCADAVMNDSKGSPIAYMSSKCGVLVTLSNLLSNGEVPVSIKQDYLDYMLTSYDESMENARKKYAVTMIELKRMQKKEEYSRYMREMVEGSIRSMTAKMARIRDDIAIHLRGINNSEDKLHRYSTFLSILKSDKDSEAMKKRMEEDFELLIKLEEKEKYQCFNFEGSSVVGTTVPIKLFGKYELGEFEVRLGIDGVVKCHNISGRLADGHYDHPHINDGFPCFGNIGHTVVKLVRGNNFGAAFDLMYDFLNSYNDGRGDNDRGHKPYIRIEKGWPEFEQQGLRLCGNCQRIHELCKCGDGEQRARLRTPSSNVSEPAIEGEAVWGTQVRPVVRATEIF